MSKAKQNNAVRNFLAQSTEIHARMETVSAEQRAELLKSMEIYAADIAYRYNLSVAELADLAENYETLNLVVA